MGHRAPYVAVITLAVMAAHHWRTIRLKLTLGGIADPMMLPSMHILLDAVESAILESMHGSSSGDGEMKRSMFLDSLYGPSPANNLNGDDYSPTPEGFGDEEVEASFDAFAQAAL